MEATTTTATSLLIILRSAILVPTSLQIVCIIAFWKLKNSFGTTLKLLPCDLEVTDLNLNFVMHDKVAVKIVYNRSFFRILHWPDVHTLSYSFCLYSILKFLATSMFSPIFYVHNPSYCSHSLMVQPPKWMWARMPMQEMDQFMLLGRCDISNSSRTFFAHPFWFGFSVNCDTECWLV